MKLKKSQAAFEFLILAGVMMAIFVMFFAIASEKIVEFNEARRDKVAQDIMDVVTAELELAQQSMDGYTRNFTMPPTIEGNDYEMRINRFERNYITLMYTGKLYDQVINIDLEGDGNTVYKGINQIKKKNGKITVYNSNDPCNPPLVIGADSYCIGGKCYCNSGYYAPAGICEHEDDFDLSKEQCPSGCVNFDSCNPAPAILPGAMGTVAVTPGNPSDSKAALSFATNESAKATIQYGEANAGVCSDFSNAAGEASFATSHNAVLDNLHASTDYCFEIEVKDKKGASQYYGIIRLPTHIFTTGADISPPLVRYALIFPPLIPSSPEHEYNQKMELFVNIIDDTGIEWSSTKAIIRQKEADGTEKDIITLDNLKDKDTDCDSDPTRDVYDDDGYMQCFWTDSSFAKYASYGADADTLFYASYDSSTTAEKGGDPNGGNVDQSSIVSARYGNGLQMTGSNAIFYGPLSDKFDLNKGTLEMWFKPLEISPSLKYLFYEGSPSNAFRLFTSGTSATFSMVSYGSWVVSSGSFASLNQWYFIAITWDNINSGSADGEMHMYINGNEVAASQTGVQIGISAGDKIYVGSTSEGSLGANAVIDHFRILDHAKTSAQIKADYETRRDYYIYFETKDTAGNPTGYYGPGDYTGTSTFPVNYKAP